MGMQEHHMVNKRFLIQVCSKPTECNYYLFAVKKVLNPCQVLSEILPDGKHKLKGNQNNDDPFKEIGMLDPDLVR